MARLNSADELEALRRQQIELAKRIKEVEVKTRLKEKADNERREQIAGRAVITYLAANPQSEISKAIVAVLETGIVQARRTRPVLWCSGSACHGGNRTRQQASR